jgi:hypothetical protein
MSRTGATVHTLPGVPNYLTWWQGYDRYLRPHHSGQEALAPPWDPGGRLGATRREPQRWSMVDLLSQRCLDTV